MAAAHRAVTERIRRARTSFGLGHLPSPNSGLAVRTRAPQGTCCIRPRTECSYSGLASISRPGSPARPVSEGPRSSESFQRGAGLSSWDARNLSAFRLQALTLPMPLPALAGQFAPIRNSIPQDGCCSRWSDRCASRGILPHRPLVKGISK